MLLNQYGDVVKNGPGHEKLDRFLDAERKVFQGVVKMALYDDAITAKATCAFCFGAMEGVLRFDPEYLTQCRDREDRLRDMRNQVVDRIQRDHFCGARINDGKDLIDDVMKRFENTAEVRSS